MPASRDIERDEGLCKFVWHHRVKQEQRRDSGEGAAQRIDVEQVALDDGDACGEVGLRRVPDEGANIRAALHELFDNLTADSAGRAGNKNRHDDYSLVWVQVVDVHTVRDSIIETQPIK